MLKQTLMTKFALVSLFTIVIAQAAQAADPIETNVFGPQKVTRATGKPKVETYNFNLPALPPSQINPRYEMRVVNGAGIDAILKPCKQKNLLQYLKCQLDNLVATIKIKRTQVVAATVKLNGVTLLKPSNFNFKTDHVILAVQMQPVTNKIEIQVDGIPGSYITVNIVRLTDGSEEPVNLPPVADFTFSPPAVELIAPTVVTFNALNSSDPDGAIATYAWEFGDSSAGSGVMPMHAYQNPGLYNVRLTVTDDKGAANSKTVAITILPDTTPAVITLSSPTEGAAYNATNFLLAGSSNEALASLTLSLNGSAPVAVALNSSGTSFSQTVTPGALGDQTLVLVATDLGGNPTTMTRNFNVSVNTPPIARFTSDKTSGTAPLMVMFDAATSTDGESSLTYAWNFGDGQTAQGEQVAHEFIQAGDFSVSLTVTDAGGLTSSAQIAIHVLQVPTVPDPITVAPILPTVKVATFAESVAFLYSGPDPIQKNVAANVILARRESVIRGRVIDAASSPVQGVKVSVLRAPNLGYTLTRADGRFDIAVNGGGQITLVYERSGYFSVQRQVQTVYNQFFEAPEVVVTRQDTQVTNIALNAVTAQVARGSMSQDASGSRTATVLIPAQTTAELIMPNGSRQSVSQLSLRATEYTVGTNGVKAMPAPLPHTSAYTYAVELSADEAIALGAEHIEFSKPVAFYVENFLGFTVGGAVPVGVYDRARDVWVPQPNGRVIRIQSESAGRAVLTVSTSGQIATQTELDVLGIDQAELTTLAQTYEPGQSLWRIRTSRFSTVDANWFEDPSGEAKEPNVGGPEIADDVPEDGGTIECSSIIQVETQALGERIGLVGVDSALNYSSRNMPGRLSKKTLKIPITANILPAGLKRVDLTVQTAGQIFQKSFSNPSANLQEIYTWDGKDAYGRTVQNDIMVEVKLGYVYDGTYLEALNTQTENVFANIGGELTATAIPSRNEISYERIYSAHLGVSSFLIDQSIAGWTLSDHHFYNPVSKILYLGDGSEREADDIGQIMTTIAGTGEEDSGGDGGLAKEADINAPVAVTVLRDGSLVISEEEGQRIRKVSVAGVISTIAGTGVAGFSGDGGPATQAQVYVPGHVSEAPDGSLYFDDFANHRIRKISPGGIISTVAGTGVGGYSGDGGLATQAELNYPRGVLVGNDGSIYVGDGDNNRIRRISTDGIISTIAGTGVAGFSGDDGPAIQATLSAPYLMGMGNQGELYIADGDNNRIRRIDASGTITTVAGNGTLALSGDGGPALLAGVGSPFSVEVGRDGSLYISQGDFAAIRRVAPDGLISSLTAISGAGFTGDGNLATRAQISFAGGLALGFDDAIYLSDTDNNRIRKISKAYPGFGTANILIASDDGSELYTFDATGRHINTLFAKTGAIKRQFEYTSGRLTAMVDSFGNRTEVARDSSGRPTRITSPYGQNTELATNAQGYLSSVSSPSNETYSMSYNSGGLLTAFQNPRGAESIFAYDAEGKLIKDTNALGHFLSFLQDPQTSEVVMTTSENNISSASVTKYSTGASERNSVDKAGLVTQTIFPEDGKKQVNVPTGLSVLTSEAIDPRIPSLLYEKSSTVTLPSGLINTATVNKTLTDNDPDNIFDFTERVSATVNGRTFNGVYNSATRTATMTSPQGRVISSVIDAQERVVSQAQTGITPIQYAYDTRGRLSAIQQGTRISNFTYDSHGNLASMTDPAGRVTSYVRDNSGRALSSTLPDGRVVQYNYDPTGNLVSVTPPEKPSHGFVFNLLDMVTEYAPPSLVSTPVVSTVYAYNRDKKLTLMTRPNGESAGYVYDGAGRVTTIVTGGGNYGSSYSPTTGLLSSESSPDGVSTSYIYDGGLVRSVTQTGAAVGSLALTYNSDFNLASSSVSGGAAVNFSYNADGMLSTAGLLSISYSPQNSLISQTFFPSTATIEDISYDQFGAMTADNFRHIVLGPLFSLNVTRDNLGRVVTKTEARGASTISNNYGYDLQGRLTSVNRNGDLRIYNYDANGNRLSATINGATEFGTYDAQDRLLSYGGNVYSYDANGDLTSKVTPSGTVSYDFDVMGNLQSAALADGRVINYVTDARDRRVGKKVNGVTTQQFVYQNQLQIAAELDSAGAVVSRFVYATKSNVPDYMIKGGQMYRIISDQVGSVRYVLNVAGSVVQEIQYDEFGRMLSDTNPGFQPFGFAGGLWDRDTGLVRFGARDYDAETGRFVSKDPILFNGGSSNLYQYSLNDPINFIDPSGLTQEEVDAAVAWLRQNRPDLFEGTSSSLAISDGWAVGGAGLYLPGQIIVDTDAHGGSTNVRMAGIVQTVAHELMHAQDGFLNTITGNGRGHDFIDAQEPGIGMQYLDSVSKKQKNNSGVSCP